jgi:hypothetical protein
MADLFGLEQVDKRTNDRPEAAALLEVLKAVRAHPLVAWHSWPVTCATCCASWGCHDLPDVHAPAGCDVVGPVAGYGVPLGAGGFQTMLKRRATSANMFKAKATSYLSFSAALQSRQQRQAVVGPLRRQLPGQPQPPMQAS